MHKAKENFNKAINLWLVPFLIGGSIATGYEITHKTLTKIENKSKNGLEFHTKEIISNYQKKSSLLK